MLSAANRALPAHHRRISAHDGDWRCRCRNPKRIKPLTLCSSKNLFKATPRKTAPAGPATGCPESGHCSPPEWARRRAEESWGVWLGLFFLHKVCCVRCSMGWGTCVSIFLSLVFLHWPFAGQVTTQHECGFWRSGWTRFESVAGRDLRFSVRVWGQRHSTTTTRAYYHDVCMASP